MFKKLSNYILFRYIVSGGMAAIVDLGLLYTFNIVIKVHYIPASILAFLGAFVVSFTFQKFWTFRNMSKHNMHVQAFVYLSTSLLGLGLNTLLMYTFVDIFYINVILSQIFAGALVACCTFFLSRHIVFKPLIT